MPALDLNRKAYRFVGRPASLKAHLQRCDTDPANTAPLRHGSGYTSDRDQVVRPRVVGLLLSSGPTHIAGLVVAAVVNAIQRMVQRRTGPHVPEECVEAVSPFLAHRYPASAIRLKFWIRGLEAAGLGCSPDVLFVAKPQHVLDLRGHLAGSRAVLRSFHLKWLAFVFRPAALAGHRNPGASLWARPRPNNTQAFPRTVFSPFVVGRLGLKHLAAAHAILDQSHRAIISRASAVSPMNGAI